MTPDQFFERVRDWSQYKHEILRKYLHVWVFKLGSSNDTIAFVDTCAGAGRYADGSSGSPLIAAEWNDRYLREKGRRLFVHACERRRETRSQLVQAMLPYTRAEPPLAKVHEKPWERVIGEVLDATRSIPTLFFVDPYGMKDVTIDRMKPLLDHVRHPSTEVLVRADPVLIARFAGWLRTRDGERLTAAAGFEALLQRLNVDTQDLQERIDYNPHFSPDRMQLFGSYLQAFRDRFRFVQLIPIRPDYFRAPKYFLIHGTDSDHGAACINDAAATTEDRLFEDTVEAENRTLGQMTLGFVQERPRRHTLVQLQSAVIEFLSREPMALIELRAKLAMRFGPDFCERHHKAVIRELVKQ